ncbi:MAG: flagellar biosynthesis protein FlhB [Chitinispirillaceae bacterium]|nr:flagellar biosynthesis protein FlhB [Chitinispirillaceae bacterium]
MAEESQDEKTEAPTPKRRGEARQKGTVVKSTEINSVMVLLVGLFMLKLFGMWMLGKMGSHMLELYRSISDTEMSMTRITMLAGTSLVLAIQVMLPVVVGIIIIGLVANILQIGFLFTVQPVIPNLNKINPLSGLKRMFSMRTTFEAVKNIVKLAIIGAVAYWTVKGEFDKIMVLADASIAAIVQFTADTAFNIILRVALVLFILAILDWAYQKYEHEKQLKMTKQEVKDERKQADGDPQVKGRIKSVQREMARRRMMQEVPRATVVVTNPTFIAIALRYEPSENDAPIVLAKGKRLIAEKIRQMALEHGIPIVEDKPLARHMYDKIDVGFPIPAEFYTAVAEIMAYVYRLKNRRAA